MHRRPACHTSPAPVDSPYGLPRRTHSKPTCTGVHSPYPLARYHDTAWPSHRPHLRARVTPSSPSSTASSTSRAVLETVRNPTLYSIFLPFLILPQNSFGLPHCHSRGSPNPPPTTGCSLGAEIAGCPKNAPPLVPHSRTAPGGARPHRPIHRCVAPHIARISSSPNAVPSRVQLNRTHYGVIDADSTLRCSTTIVPSPSTALDGMCASHRVPRPARR
jgi:hypothetical protein